jgi:Ca2+/Na+ antiporter
MCYDDATPHIMTHDAALIVLTSLSHGTYFTFILSTLSLSLFILYFFYVYLLLSREKVVEDVEEKKEEGKGVLRRDHATAYGT